MRFAPLACLLLAGCTLDGDHLPEPYVPDAAPPLPTGACDDEQLRTDDLVLARCPDRAHLRLDFRPTGAARVTLDGFGPAVHLTDGVVGPADWTVIVWSPREDGLTVSYSGHPRAPDVTLELIPDGQCLIGATALSFGRGETLDAVDAWAISDADARFTGLGRWTTAPDGVVDWATADRQGPAPRLLAQLGRAFAFSGLDPRRPLSSSVRDAGDDSGTLRLTHAGPLSGFGEDWLSLPWAICVGTSAATTLGELGQRMRARLTSAPPAGRGHLSTRFAVDPDAPEALTSAVGAVAALGASAHLWLHGDWAAHRVEWTPHPEVAVVPGDIAPATVGVEWPALALPPAAPLILEHPEWLDGDCADACPRLDPRVPAVREHLARIRLALAEAGFEVRLVGAEHLAPSDLRALLSALDVGDLPAPTLAPFAGSRAPSEVGLSPFVALGAAPASALARQMALWSGLGPFDADRIDDLAEAEDAAARQRLVLAWAAGRGALPETADGPDIAALTARWQETAVADAMRPLPDTWFDGGETPAPAPQAWRGSDRLAVFNWSAAPLSWTRPVELAPDLADAVNLFDPLAPPLGEVDEVSIPPGDVVVWATVDDSPRDE